MFDIEAIKSELRNEAKQAGVQITDADVDVAEKVWEALQSHPDADTPEKLASFAELPVDAVAHSLQLGDEIERKALGKILEQLQTDDGYEA